MGSSYSLKYQVGRDYTIKGNKVHAISSKSTGYGHLVKFKTLGVSFTAKEGTKKLPKVFEINNPIGRRYD